jgi:hypothetical protein
MQDCVQRNEARDRIEFDNMRKDMEIDRLQYDEFKRRLDRSLGIKQPWER